MYCCCVGSVLLVILHIAFQVVQSEMLCSFNNVVNQAILNCKNSTQEIIGASVCRNDSSFVYCVGTTVFAVYSFDLNRTYCADASSGLVYDMPTRTLFKISKVWNGAGPSNIDGWITSMPDYPSSGQPRVILVSSYVLSNDSQEALPLYNESQSVLSTLITAKSNNKVNSVIDVWAAGKILSGGKKSLVLGLNSATYPRDIDRTGLNCDLFYELAGDWNWELTLSWDLKEAIYSWATGCPNSTWRREPVTDCIHPKVPLGFDWESMTVACTNNQQRTWKTLTVPAVCINNRWVVKQDLKFGNITWSNRDYPSVINGSVLIPSNSIVSIFSPMQAINLTVGGKLFMNTGSVITLDSVQLSPTGSIIIMATSQNTMLWPSILINGCALLDGSLEVHLNLTAGQPYNLLNYNCYNGTFKNITLTNDAITNDNCYSLEYHYNSEYFRIEWRPLCSSPKSESSLSLILISTLSIVGVVLLIVVLSRVPYFKKKCQPYAFRKNLAANDEPSE